MNTRRVGLGRPRPNPTVLTEALPQQGTTPATLFCGGNTKATME